MNIFEHPIMPVQSAKLEYNLYQRRLGEIKSLQFQGHIIDALLMKLLTDDSDIILPEELDPDYVDHDNIKTSVIKELSVRIRMMVEDCILLTPSIFSALIFFIQLLYTHAIIRRWDNKYQDPILLYFSQNAKISDLDLSDLSDELTIDMENSIKRELVNGIENPREILQFIISSILRSFLKAVKEKDFLESSQMETAIKEFLDFYQKYFNLELCVPEYLTFRQIQKKQMLTEFSLWNFLFSKMGEIREFVLNYLQGQYQDIPSEEVKWLLPDQDSPLFLPETWDLPEQPQDFELFFNNFRLIESAKMVSSLPFFQTMAFYYNRQHDSLICTRDNHGLENTSETELGVISSIMLKRKAIESVNVSLKSTAQRQPNLYLIDNS